MSSACQTPCRVGRQESFSRLFSIAVVLVLVLVTVTAISIAIAIATVIVTEAAIAIDAYRETLE